MELSDVLILASLAGNFVLFIFCIFLLVKVFFVETVVKGLKNPEKILQDILKTKIPVLRNADTGEIIMPGQEDAYEIQRELEKHNKQQKPNPITG